MRRISTMVLLATILAVPLVPLGAAEPADVTVAPLRVGAEFEYLQASDWTTYENDVLTGQGASTPNQDGFRVHEVRAARDATHQEHQALFLVGDKRTFDSGAYQWQKYFDLDDRLPVRTEVLLDRVQRGATTSYVTVLHQRCHAGPNVLEMAVAAAGRSFEIGVEQPGLAAAIASCRDATTTISSLRASWRSPVDWADQTLTPFVVEYAFSSVEYGVVGNVTLVLWYRPDTAMPVYVEEWSTTIEGESRREDHHVRQLTRTAQGHDVVPWGTCPAEEHQPSTDAARERRARTDKGPAEGHEKSLPVPLSKAVQHALNDAALPRFAQWRVAHPDHFLVGARMTPIMGINTEPVMQWSLVFGTESGEAYRIESTADPTRTTLVNSEEGEFAIPSVNLPRRAQLSPDTITIAAAVEKHREIAPESARRPVNYFWWGLWWIGDAKNPNYNDDVMRRSYGVDALDVIEVQVAVADFNPQTLPMSKEGNAVAINISSGLTVRAKLWRQEQNFTNYVVSTRDTVEEKIGLAPALASTQAARPSPQSGPLLLAISGTVATLGLLALLLPWLRTLIPGYAKITKDRLLDLQARDQILHQLQAQPGQAAADLQRASRLHWSTVSYHLGVLEKNQIVSSVRDGRRRRYFPASAVAWSERERVGVLQNDSTRRLFQRVEQQPGIRRAELAEALGISLPALYLHVQRLERAGLLRSERDGQRIRYYPTATSV